MSNLPSGAGQTDAAHSLSVVLASDAAAAAAPAGSSTSAIQTTQQTSLDALNTKLATPLPLPTGAATSASQTTQQTSLTSIDGKLTAQRGPSRGDNLFAVAMTTSTSITDFSAATQLLADIAAGKEFVLTAEGGDIWYQFNQAASGTISATAVGLGLAVTVCDYIPAGQSTPPMTIPTGTLGLIALASNASAILRMRRVN